MARGDLVRALTLVARKEDPAVVAQFVRSNAEELAPLLEVGVGPLRSIEERPDLGRRLLTHLAGLRHHREGARQAEARQRAVAAAAQVAQSAEYQFDRLVLPVRPLLGGLVDDKSVSLISFERVGAAALPIDRGKLGELSHVMRRFDVLAAWLTDRGLWVSWCGGRGRICIFPKDTRGVDRSAILPVVFSAPLEVAPVAPPWGGWLEAFAGSFSL